MNYETFREMEEQVDELACEIHKLYENAMDGPDGRFCAERKEVQRVYSKLCSLMFFFKENPPESQVIAEAQQDLSRVVRTYARLLGRTLPEFV